MDPLIWPHLTPEDLDFDRHEFTLSELLLSK